MIKIRHYRRKRGLTQTKLAKYLGVSSQTLSNWERGLTEPDIHSLCSLSSILRVSIDSLLESFMPKKKR